MRRATIEEYKNVVTNLLAYIDKLCKENGIQYFVFYGTLLGAIRHNGFIPWDDDIDICMLRKDYEKFLKLFPRENGRYSILHWRTSKQYAASFAKVCDNTLTMKIRGGYWFDHYGAPVDVFPLDKIPDNANIDEVYRKYNEFTQDIIKYGLPIECYKSVSMREKIKFLIRLPRYLTKHSKSKQLRQKRDKWMQRFEGIETSTYVD